MSLVISSTTDSQEAVNTAAGISPNEAVVSTPEPQSAPTTDTPPAEPDTEPKGDEPEEQDDEQKEPTDPQPKKKGGFQRKIERLEAEREQALRHNWALQQELAARMGQQPPAQTGDPNARPVQDKFSNYDEYIEALSDWKVAQRLKERDALEREQRAAETHQEQLRGWRDRVSTFKQEKPDFDEALQDVAHIVIPPALQQSLIDSEQGPALAYALAQDPAELERIVNLPPLAAARALGRIEAKLANGSEPKKQAVPVSRAPEPIRPVGQGAASRPKPLDELPYQEYKRRREQEIAARHKRTV